MGICTVLQLSLVTTARPPATIAVDVSDLARTGGDEMVRCTREVARHFVTASARCM